LRVEAELTGLGDAIRTFDDQGWPAPAELALRFTRIHRISSKVAADNGVEQADDSAACSLLRCTGRVVGPRVFAMNRRADG
jgi:hypothetical protein